MTASSSLPFHESPHRYFVMRNLYESAVKQLVLKLEILNSEFNTLYARNPIHHIESRVKSSESIAAKLQRKGSPVTLEAAARDINDIAGVRVVCNYIDDVYRVAGMLERQEDLEIVKRQDYIKRRTITATVRCIWMSVFPCIFLTGRSTSSPRSRSARSQWTSGPVWSMTSTTRRTGQSSRRALMKRCLPVRKRSPKLTGRCRICTAASRTQKRMETPSKSKVCFFQRGRQLHGFAATGLAQSFQVSIRSSISDVNRRSR